MAIAPMETILVMLVLAKVHHWAIESRLNQHAFGRI